MNSKTSINSSHYQKSLVTNNDQRRFSSMNSNSIILTKLNQLVDTLKSLKHLISHYFDQISKQNQSNLSGDVRRIYRRIILLYVKYRRRQNYEKRQMKQIIDSNDFQNTTNYSISSSWTMKKKISSKSLSFTRAGFNVDHDEIEDFDEIALTAIRDVANIQNHCIRLLLNDHQMKLPIYKLSTRWDSQIPKQIKQNSFKQLFQHTQIPIVKKSGIKSSNITSSISNDQQLFFCSLIHQLNDQTWQQIQSILANFNFQQ